MLDTQDHAPTDTPLNDLGPLAWVFEELRKSLEGANKAIRRFIRESEQARHSDLEAVDPGALRVARQQLHQAVGALEVVGLAAPAQVLRGMEAAVQRFVQRPLSCTDEAAGKVERASFALIEYLEAVLNGKPVPPVALFSQYREVQELAGAERVHPADLWSFDRRGVEAPAPAGVPPMKVDPQVRSLFDRLVLLVVKTNSRAASTQLSRMCASLAAGAQQPRAVTFWRTAAAYFEGLSQNLLVPDVYAKRAASRILLQLAGLVQGGARADVSETLLHDLLFFCAQARPVPGTPAPHLEAVRAAFGLSDAAPVDYSQATLGRFDPALLVQARKRINAGKESWSLLAGGDLSRARSVLDQYTLIGESLLKLHPASTGLARSLVKAAEHVARSPGNVKPELSMEVATTTLYLEAAFDDFDPNDATLTDRTQLLAERLERVLAGESAQPLEPWMEQLYRRVSDRQTLGSVVGELKVALGEAEKSLDQFFRAPKEKAGLHVAVSQLVQMRGVLSVLGLEQAVQTVSRMRATVEQILDTEIDEDMAREAGTFQQLGNNLSALSFLVDMLNYQPALAKKLFVFDDQAGELRPLMGRMAPEVPVSLPSQHAAETLSQDVQRVVEGAQNNVDLAELSEQLDSLADQASLAEQEGVARAAREAAQAVVGSDAVAGAQALVGLAQSGVPAVPVAQVAPVSTPPDDDGEDDLRDIFLEEGREVVGNGLAALKALRHEPGQLEQLTILRRAFHTLKGSSRMVGLGEFGEAAWAMEQVLNSVLAEQRPAEPALLSLAQEAMTELGRWVEDIDQNQDAHWKAQPFRNSAQAWRDRREHLPLEGTLPESAVEAVEVVELTEPAAEEPVVSIEVETDDAPAVDLGVGAQESGDALVMELDLPEPVPSEHASLVDPVESGAGGEDAESPAQVDPADENPSIFDEISLDLEAELPQAQDLQDSMPAALFNPAEPDSVQVIELDAVAMPTPEPVLVEEPMSASGPAEDDEAPDVDVGEEAADIAVPSGAVTDEMLDEQTRAIGPLRIGIRLYNVYLNEADEWSRRLGVALSEWSLEQHERLPEQAEALAHSLAGSSATVGFQPLSDIARALEHALALVGSHQRAGQPATDAQAQLFVAAAEDIRRLLHQFAAGFYKEPNPELLAGLEALLHLPTPTESDAVSESTTDEPSLDNELNTQWDASSIDTGTPVDSVEPVMVVDEEPLHVAPEVLDAESLVLADDDTTLSPLSEMDEPRGPVQDIDDDIDAMDTIDVDLFPIFSDEAQELLPLLGGALRQWIARPDNGSARAEVLRNLHTLKGSARLAGALRLGEMAHRMETSVERLGTDTPQTGELEPLQSAYDALCARFDLLRSTDPASHGVVQTAPEQAAEPPLSITVEDEVVVGSGEAVVSSEAAASVAVPQGAGLSGLSLQQAPVPVPQRAGAAVRVRPELLDRLMNQTGEVMITRSRMESQLVTLRGSLKDLTGNLDRLRHQLRDIELQAETQMQSRLAQARDAELAFDPLEFDRFTRVQELTRMMAESVNDVATVQRNLQRAVEATEDGLVAQGRQTRELQRDLLRTRMVEFEGISERLYRVVRQASKETGKQVRLDITAGHIEMDRGVLDRMTAAFEHLLRNSVVHGIESPERRLEKGKPAEGHIEIRLAQELNDVSVTFEDDGAGIDLARLREKALAQGLVPAGAVLSDDEAAQLIYTPGLSTAAEVSSLAGRGVGMDVVRNDVVALGGRIETHTHAGQGSSFKLVLPLTTAVTQVVMLRAGELTVGVPSTQVELVRRVSADELAQAYARKTLLVGGEEVPFYWAGALLQSTPQSQETQTRTLPVVIFRSAAQRVAMHVDEVLGNQEVVVKNLGPQLSRLPGLAGMSVLASGAVALIYNPVALATVYGDQVQPWIEGRLHRDAASSEGAPELPVEAAVSAVPLVLVVDDSITVRRVTQRLLQREGYRVTLAADGLQALERLQQERPTVVLSDIEMPRMDGFDLVRNIRNDPRLSDLPVIMITSRIAEKHREHARELGVDHYLGKPYSEDELLALVANYAQAAANA